MPGPIFCPSPALITPQHAEPDDVAPNCSSCSETAYSKAKKRELHAWDAVKDDMLKVSFECSAPITTQCVVCLEHADYRCIECSTTAVFCEACLRRTHRNAHCSRCVFTAVSVHLDGLNAEDKFRVWVTILGHTPLPLPLPPSPS